VDAVLVTAREWIAALGEEVCPVELDDEQVWMLATDAREALRTPPQRTVRLIPAFDQYVIGASRHAEHLLPGDLRKPRLSATGLDFAGPAGQWVHAGGLAPRNQGKPRRKLSSSCS